MSTTVDARVALMSRLNTPPYDDAAGTYSTPLGEAAQLLDAYRAAVVAEVVEALQEKAGELSTEAEEEMRRDLEEQAQVWHEAAAVAAKLKAQDGEPYCTDVDCVDCSPDDECCETVCGVCPRVSAHDGCTMTRGELDDTRSCREHGMHDILMGA